LGKRYLVRVSFIAASAVGRRPSFPYFDRKLSFKPYRSKRRRDYSLTLAEKCCLMPVFNLTEGRIASGFDVPDDIEGGGSIALQFLARRSRDAQLSLVHITIKP
jgi:hypothetical protein